MNSGRLPLELPPRATCELRFELCPVAPERLDSYSAEIWVDNGKWLVPSRLRFSYLLVGEKGGVHRSEQSGAVSEER